MIVVFVIVMVLKIRFVVAKADFACQSSLSKQLQSSIDRRVPDARIAFLDKTMKVLNGQMLFGAEKRLHYQIALRRFTKTRPLNAVSYTHLDVYKRQAFARPRYFLEYLRP